MVQQAITLPLRLGLRVATLGFSAAHRLIHVVVPRRGEAAPAPSPSVHKPPPAPSRPVREAPAPEPPPAHVSRDAQVVETFADPGAEEGAGAAVRIEEPWRGYGHMTAADVIARLTGASREELAAVALYERAHRDRRTVVAAAERELERATAAARRPG